MKEILLIFLAILFSCNNIKEESIESSTNGVFSGNLSVSTSSQLIIGEKIIIQYSINERGSNFIPPNFSNLKVLGEPYDGSTQSSYSFVNGKSISTTKTTWYIDIEAKDTGLYVISPASVIVKGKKIVSDEFKLNITNSVDALESELRSLEKGETTNLADNFLKNN